MITVAEALAGLVSRPLRFLLLAAIWSSAASLALVSASAAYGDAAQFEAHARAAGAFILVVEPVDGALPGARCDRLAGVAPVIAAGGFAAAQYSSIPQAPGLSVRFVLGTPGLLAVLPPVAEQLSPSIIVGDQIARELGLGDGSLVSVGNDVHAAALIPAQMYRTQSFDRAFVLVHNPHLAVDGCMVEFASGADSTAVDAVIRAAFADLSAGVVVRPLVSRGPFIETSSQRLARALGPSSWLWCGFALAVVESLALLLRRSEFGLLLALGARPGQLIGVQLTELVIKSAIGFSVAVATFFVSLVVGAVPLYHGQAVFALTTAALAMTLGVASSAWLPVLISRRHVVRYLKDH